MFKFLIKNPKRIFRNFLIIIFGYLATLSALGLIAYFMKDKFESVPLYVTVIGAGVCSVLITLGVVAFVGQFANKRDAELRRRFRAETNNLDTTTIAAANGITNTSVLNTSRDAKTIKKELVDLQVELYHAQERDKNLKLGKKF